MRKIYMLLLSLLISLFAIADEDLINIDQLVKDYAYNEDKIVLTKPSEIVEYLDSLGEIKLKDMSLKLDLPIDVLLDLKNENDKGW